MTTTEGQTTALPRRQVLCGIVAMGLLGTTTLAGCSDDPATTDSPASGNKGSSNDAGGALAKVSGIPVGGGTVVQAPDGSQVVIVQPNPGEIKAYNASCTHMGTTVGAPQNGVMTCPNHGSKFRASDGSVVNGPAGSPLKSVAVTVSGDDIKLA